MTLIEWAVILREGCGHNTHHLCASCGEKAADCISKLAALYAKRRELELIMELEKSREIIDRELDIKG